MAIARAAGLSRELSAQLGALASAVGDPRSGEDVLDLAVVLSGGLLGSPFGWYLIVE
ncbi:MAG: hypothetical protein H0V41_01575 [Pseudonocardiales bacterium]|nr:hypothetical protein [Pseudonocardiales bacterium]